MSILHFRDGKLVREDTDEPTCCYYHDPFESKYYHPACKNHHEEKRPMGPYLHQCEAPVTLMIGYKCNHCKLPIIERAAPPVSTSQRVYPDWEDDHINMMAEHYESYSLKTLTTPIAPPKEDGLETAKKAMEAFTATIDEGENPLEAMYEAEGAHLIPTQAMSHDA